MIVPVSIKNDTRSSVDIFFGMSISEEENSENLEHRSLSGGARNAREIPVPDPRKLLEKVRCRIFKRS